jgi:hypothetical protein
MNLRLFAATVVITLVTLASAPRTHAATGRFFSEIVQSTDQPLTVEVRRGQVVRLVNFVQDGGTERATITVTRNNVTVTLLISTFSGSEIETQKELVISSPATITIKPMADAKLFFTYRVENN